VLQPRAVRDRCPESIRAQTYRNIQLILADDASTDGSVDLIRGWLARTETDCTLVLHEQNQGICRTRNDALAYVSSLSTDDVWLPDKLADQVAQLEEAPVPTETFPQRVDPGPSVT
jgi:glycosyltransferase involved in cell wall biosynthesis